MCSRVGAEQTDPSSLELISLEGHFVLSRRIQNTPVTQYTNESAAVSEVIGTLILVGVVMIGIVLVGLLLLSQPPPTKVPHFNALISNQSKNIYILHKGGDALISGEYQILVDGVDQTSSFVSNGDEPWSVGETLSYLSATMPQKVVIVHSPGRESSTVIMGSDLNPILTVPLHPPIPPSIDWSSFPDFGNVTTTFQFSDSTTGANITSYYWDFNDANTSTLQFPPAHAFPCNTGDSCSYSISHSATDSGGTDWEATSWLNRSAAVTIYKNLTPTITFTQDRTFGPAGFLSVNFAATQYGAIKVDSWSWDFGDTGTSSSEDPSHTYTTQGIYTVTLTATNYTLGVTMVTKSGLIQVTAPWYSCSWAYRKNITLNKTAVAADLTYFPVLVSLAADADLAADAQNDGDDILFTSSDGTTKIPHEIENFAGGTGLLVAWVNVSSLSSSANTTIFMYYGAAGGSQQDPAHVWDSNYKGVWHYNNNLLDSTSNNNDGANTGTANLVAGKIDRARSSDGSNNWVQMTQTASINNLFAAGGSFEAWIYTTNAGENNPYGGYIADKSSSYTGTNGWMFGVQSGINLSFGKGFSVANGNWSTAKGTISRNVWQHVVVTYDSSNIANNPTMYINGTAKAVTIMKAPSGVASSDAANNMRTFNAVFGNARDFSGYIDEARASKTIRTASWITTEYTNQDSPSRFHYLMPEEGWTC
jgi:PKD repeat protein